MTSPAADVNRARPAETFTVRLSQPSATRIHDATGVVTIVDDD